MGTVTLRAEKLSLEKDATTVTSFGILPKGTLSCHRHLPYTSGPYYGLARSYSHELACASAAHTNYTTVSPSQSLSPLLRLPGSGVSSEPHSLWHLQTRERPSTVRLCSWCSRQRRRARRLLRLLVRPQAL
jgi:hypothetical protein